MRRTLAIAVIVLLVLCCLAAVAGGLAYLLRVRAVEARPVILIGSPGQGENVQVGEAVVVQATARDETGVVRVELWVDGELEEARRSTLSEGTSPFPLVTRWEPLSPGTHTLAVRAFNSDDARAYVSVMVDAVELLDRDGDGVADEDDSCPDEPGLATLAGCPDRDGDGVADSDDACPEEVGTAEAGGCPLVGEGDRDGDGVLDDSDACADEPGPQRTDGCPDGDGDGVADADDACPSEPGVGEQSGCPAASDLDGDGVSDEDDDCPVESGSAAQGGCPDADGDGVRDLDDLRPTEPGEVGNHGAPDTGAPDSDGDGLADDVDRCDLEAGSVEQEGCPPPEERADLDGDGRPDDTDEPGGGIPLWPPPGGVPLDPVTRTVVLDVEALEFQVYDDYDEIYCYIGLAGEGMERYGPLDPVSQTHWDIAALLGGENSRRIVLPLGEDLDVRMECGAYGEVTESETGFGEVGQEAVYFDLGSFAQRHSQEEWDGQPITVERSEGGADGRFFRATYRICIDSCAETALPVPHLWTQEIFGGQRFLIWTWTGDPESIDGFRARYDCYDRTSGVWWRGATVGTYPDEWSRSIEQFEPDCASTCEWYVWAYRESDGVESPHSNIAVVDVGPCPRGRTVTTEFEMLMPNQAADGRGPIYGEFWANEEVLSFDGADASYCDFYDYECGYYIRGHELSTGYAMGIWVADLFRSIRELKATSPQRYSAPEVNIVSVPVSEGDTLTLGYSVWEYHLEGEDVLLCSDQSTIEYDELHDTDYYLFPTWETATLCRVRASMSVYNWIGG
jgi:hypothetical protein